MSTFETSPRLRRRAPLERIAGLLEALRGLEGLRCVVEYLEHASEPGRRKAK